MPPLAPVSLRPSRQLWHWQWLLHLVLALALLGSLWPHLPSQPHWRWLLLLCWAVLAFSAWRCWRQLQRPGLCLGYTGGWYLEVQGRRQALVLVGQVVLWQRLLVLPFRPATGGRRVVLVLLPDSAEPQAQRRLRVWLRTQLHRQLRERG